MPSSPKARSAAAPRSTVEAPGFGSTSSKTAGLETGRREHAEDPVDDARAADARIGHDEDARATGRGDHLGEPLDRTDPEEDAIAQDDLDLPIGEPGHATSTTVSVEVSRRTVSQRRQPKAWNQRSVVDAVGVVEDPDLVEVALVRVGDRVGDGAPLAAEGELVDRAATAARAVEPEHQRVPAEPWSARTWSRRKRSSPNGAISAGGRPVAISSAIPSPPAGIALKPQVPQPVVTRNPSTPVAPMIGE